MNDELPPPHPPESDSKGAQFLLRKISSVILFQLLQKCFPRREELPTTITQTEYPECRNHNIFQLNQQ